MLNLVKPILSLLILCAFACTQENPKPDPDSGAEPQDGGVISIYIPSDPQTLNNMTRSGSFGQMVTKFLYPKLLEIDMDTFELIPVTAASLPEVSEDKKTHIWRLREGLKWDDFETSGAFVTSKDIKFSFDVMKDKNTGASFVESDFDNLISIEPIDRFSFKAIYDEPSADDVYRMGYYFRLIPAHLLEDTPKSEISKAPISQAPVGFGNFKFHHWTRNKEILVVRNDLNREIFPEIIRPRAHGIRWVIISDPNVAFTQLLRGELDLYTLSHDQWTYKSDSPEFKAVANKYNYYMPFWTYISWNHDLPMFSDPKTRWAMSHMVRRDEVLNSHLKDMAKVVTGPFFCNSEALDRSIKPIPFDPEKAKALLKEAGWEDRNKDGILDKEVQGERKDFAFEFLVGASSTYNDALIVGLKEDLRKIGVKMEIRNMEWSAFLERARKRAADAFTLGAVTTPIFEDPYPRFHSSEIGDGGLNRAGYRNPQVDKLMEQARIEFDSGKRFQMLKKVHQLIYEDQPLTFLYSLTSNIAVNKRWRNIKIYKLGVNMYEWWRPKDKHKSTDQIPR